MSVGLLHIWCGWCGRGWLADCDQAYPCFQAGFLKVFINCRFALSAWPSWVLPASNEGDISRTSRERKGKNVFRHPSRSRPLCRKPKSSTGVVRSLLDVRKCDSKARPTSVRDFLLILVDSCPSPGFLLVVHYLRCLLSSCPRSFTMTPRCLQGLPRHVQLAFNP